MLGLGDFAVSLVFVLTILSMILCLVYGIANWNKDGTEDAKVEEEERQWQDEERNIEETL